MLCCGRLVYIDASMYVVYDQTMSALLSISANKRARLISGAAKIPVVAALSAPLRPRED